MSLLIETHSAIGFIAVIIIHREFKVNSFYPLTRLFSAFTGVKFYFLNQFSNEQLFIGVVQKIKQNIKGLQKGVG